MGQGARVQRGGLDRGRRGGGGRQHRGQPDHGVQVPRRPGQAVIGPLASYSNLIGCHSQVRHYKMVGANHVTEPTNRLAKQILLDIIVPA